MLEIEMKPELEEILESYAKKDGVSKGELARRAIAEYLEDREDADLADEASRDMGETYSLEEVIRELGLKDQIRGEGKERGQRAGLLQGSRREPFDRMLTAPALAENIAIVSDEEVFGESHVCRLW